MAKGFIFLLLTMATAQGLAAPPERHGGTNKPPAPIARDGDTNAVAPVVLSEVDRQLSPVQQVDKADRFMAQENFVRARLLYEAALASQPTNKAAALGLSTALIKLDLFREAEVLLRRAVAQYPKEYAIKNNLAWIYANAPERSLRDARKAIALCQEALIIAPQDYHTWSTLADAYYQSGQYDRALRSAEQSLGLCRTFRVDAASQRIYEAQVEKCRRAAAASIFLPDNRH